LRSRWSVGCTAAIPCALDVGGCFLPACWPRSPSLPTAQGCNGAPLPSEGPLRPASSRSRHGRHKVDQITDPDGRIKDASVLSQATYATRPSRPSFLVGQDMTAATAAHCALIRSCRSWISARGCPTRSLMPGPDPPTPRCDRATNSKVASERRAATSRDQCGNYC
jgi:hypothetical protein